MQSPEVKQTAVKTLADVYKVFNELFKNHAEKDAEWSWFENTTLFYVVVDVEGSREVAVQPNLAAMVFVRLDNLAEELWEAAKAFHGHPSSLSAYCAKHFSQVHKRYIQSFVQLPAFLSELSEDKHHVCGVHIGPETTMSFL